MKTSDLAGKALDRWVAKAIGLPPGPAYSSDWAVAGPLLEKERVMLSPMPGKGWIWCAAVVSLTGNPRYQEGMTPLQAAMRALVVYKIGTEVPDEG
ncbi:phage protein NinX family protein [Acidovorax sp. A1169]|uniref:phage protein NinX family protein n=1 Tax=Acidovorax sp. A1169 TaxID=3059524 RepID=UPI002737C320|nr:phage protein NinX family protein [Acidovorax sp. A1169]MDP4076265.1 DUF2591 family protein [Acidovorax sp. A1169]